MGPDRKSNALRLSPRESDLLQSVNVDPKSLTMRIGAGWFNTVFTDGSKVYKIPTRAGLVGLGIMSDGDPLGIVRKRIDTCDEYFPDLHVPTDVLTGDNGFVIRQPFLHGYRRLTGNDLGENEPVQANWEQILETNRQIVNDMQLCLDLVGFYPGGRMIVRGILGLPPSNFEIGNLMINPKTNEVRLVDHDLIETHGRFDSPRDALHTLTLTAERLAVRYATGYDLLGK